MLRTSLGAFRGAVGRAAIPARSAVGRTTQIGQRGIANKATSTRSSLRAGTGTSGTLGAVFGLRQPRLPSWFSRRAFRSSKPHQSQAGDTAGSLSLSARFRKLSREYGWAAVGVYLGLTILDLPLCFLLVKQLGTERIAEAEHFVVSHVQKVIPQGAQDWWHEYRKAQKGAEKEVVSNSDVADGVEMAGWGVREAEERNQAEASLATQLALAYAIHKTFIFVRVPLAAAITPKVVKVLRGWGWQIGKRRPKVPAKP